MRLPRARALERHRPIDDCLLASERSNAAREQVAGVLPRPGPQRLGPARPARASCATSSSARAAAPASSRSRLVTSPGELDATGSRRGGRAATACCGRRRRGLGETHARAARPRCSPARRARRGARRPRLPDLARGVLPDEHRDGRAALRARVEYAGPAAAGSASSTSTAASARSASRSPPRAREVWGVEIVEDAVADAIANARAQRDRQRALLRRRRPARAARAGRARRAPRRRSCRPAARRPLAEDRAPDHRGRAEADRLRLLQPDDARAERGPARRGGLRARQGPPGRHVPADAAHRVRRGCWSGSGAADGAGAGVGGRGADRLHLSGSCAARARRRRSVRGLGGAARAGRLALAWASAAAMRAATIRDGRIRGRRASRSRAPGTASSWSASAPPASTAPT